MKLICTGVIDPKYFTIGKVYDAEQFTQQAIAIMQDDLVSDFHIDDAWIAFEKRCIIDGTLFIEINNIARFAKVAE